MSPDSPSSWLNYHHLLYFWTVVREGGVVRAAERLRLAQPTVSSQVRALEAALGERLFIRSGRRLVPTDVGQVVYRYADEIFSLGRELVDTVHGRGEHRPARLVVGVADALSKLIAYRLVAPVLALPGPIRVVCREGSTEKLLAQRYNREGFDIVDHRSWVFMGDGCMMEGVSHEAASLAGTWGLGKLTAFWDDNGISIDGEVRDWFTDDTPARFEAYGWHVVRGVDGHDPASRPPPARSARASPTPSAWPWRKSCWPTSSTSPATKSSTTVPGSSSATAA